MDVAIKAHHELGPGLPEEEDLGDLGGLARANPDEPSNHAEPL